MLSCFDSFLSWGANALVVSGLGDGWTAVEVCSSEAAQLPTSCTVHCSFGWENSAPLQPLAIEPVAFNLLITLKVVSDLLMQQHCLLISVRVSLLRWQTTSWLVLKLLCHLLTVGCQMWKWKPATAQSIFFCPTMYMSIKPELCCPGSAITAHSVVFRSFSDLENMDNSCPVTKICHNPQHVSSGLMVLVTILGIWIQHMRVYALNFPCIKISKCLPLTVHDLSKMLMPVMSFLAGIKLILLNFFNNSVNEWQAITACWLILQNLKPLDWKSLGFMTSKLMEVYGHH